MIKEKAIKMLEYIRHTGNGESEYKNNAQGVAIDMAIKELQDNSYELWKESYEVEHERNIRLEEKIKALEQEPILDKIKKMKSEIADSLEFWDYSPNNNPLARDMLETLTNFLADIKEIKSWS